MGREKQTFKSFGLHYKSMTFKDKYVSELEQRKVPDKTKTMLRTDVIAICELLERIAIALEAK